MVVIHGTFYLWNIFSRKSNARLLYDHAIHVQKIFAVEHAEYVRMSFESYEKRQASIDGIQVKEVSHTYDYLIKPIGHNDKPKDGEKLKIIFPDD